MPLWSPVINDCKLTTEIFMNLYVDHRKLFSNRALRDSPLMHVYAVTEVK